MIGLVLLIGGVIALVLSPLWVHVLAVHWIAEKFAQRRFRHYFRANEEAKFFRYTNRRTSQKYVEIKIVPFLADDIQVFKVTDKGWLNLTDDEGFQVRVVWEMKAVKGGFPYVARVVNGEVVSESVNRRLYSAITRRAEPDAVLRQIEKFFTREFSGRDGNGLGNPLTARTD